MLSTKPRMSYCKCLGNHRGQGAEDLRTVLEGLLQGLLLFSWVTWGIIGWFWGEEWHDFFTENDNWLQCNEQIGRDKFGNKEGSLGNYCISTAERWGSWSWYTVVRLLIYFGGDAKGLTDRLGLRTSWGMWMIKIIFWLRKWKVIQLPFTEEVKSDRRQVLRGGRQVFGFRHFKFEMPVRYPSSIVQCEVVYMHLEFRR